MDEKFNMGSMSLASLKNVQLNVSPLMNMERELDQSMKVMIDAGQREARRKAEMHQAAVETADNTSEMKADLKDVIHNQNDYIAMIKEQNDYIKQVLNNMFGSSEDSVVVQKEILKIIQESKPTDGMVADKGLDVVIQLVFNAVHLFLK